VEYSTEIYSWSDEQRGAKKRLAVVRTAWRGNAISLEQFLYRGSWDADKVGDQLRGYVCEHFGRAEWRNSS